jgi:hypothetical protein
MPTFTRLETSPYLQPNLPIVDRLVPSRIRAVRDYESQELTLIKQKLPDQVMFMSSVREELTPDDFACAESFQALLNDVEGILLPPLIYKINIATSGREFQLQVGGGNTFLLLQWAFEAWGGIATIRTSLRTPYSSGEEDVFLEGSFVEQHTINKSPFNPLRFVNKMNY